MLEKSEKDFHKYVTFNSCLQYQANVRFQRFQSLFCPDSLDMCVYNERSILCMLL